MCMYVCMCMFELCMNICMNVPVCMSMAIYIVPIEGNVLKRGCLRDGVI